MEITIHPMNHLCSLLHMYLPVVKAADICQALIHSAVDGGLSSFPGTFDQH